MVNCVFSFSFPKLIVPRWGNKKKKVRAVGYIGIDDSGDKDDASAGPRTSHSQLAPFTAATSVLVALLPLFSNSSRSEANKRCVRSALGCKCSISVTQNDDRSHRNTTQAERLSSLSLSFGKRGGRRERERRGGVAYLFATRYQPLYQHRLSLLRVVQLLPELLVLPHQTITP